MKPTIIDTHCHLTHPRLRPRLPEVLARAAEAGVGGVVCAASDAEDAAAGADLAERHAGVYFTAGVHPHQAGQAGQGCLAAIERLAGRAKNVAIGEIGLDYHYDLAPRPVQRRVFAGQLALARRLSKPVVVHSRQALDDVLAVLAESGVDERAVVFHSFAGGPDDVRRVLDFGACVGFSGIATFRNAESVRLAAALVPDDRLLVETDAPFLSPEPVRKTETNEPANVAHVAACLAAVRNTSPERLAELTTANAVRFFGLEPETMVG